MGREICPKTKNEHFQSFVYTKDKITPTNMANRLEKHFGVRPHTESCIGTLEDNCKYCTKDDDYYEWGTKPEQGKRTDLNEIKDSIIAGKKVDDIIIEKPIIYHQYGRTLDKIEDLTLRKKYRTEMTKGIWYYGATGCGKSKKAFENYSPDTHYIYPYDNGWCDSYKQQNTVILDDFRGQLPFNELLRMVDIHPNYYMRRRCREPMPFNSNTVIITSALHPRDVYHNLDENDKLSQLYRRFEIIKLK